MDVICMICLAWAIAQVETGGDPDEVGGEGERTLCDKAQVRGGTTTTERID